MVEVYKDFFSIIGKMLKDEYDREIGKVIAVTTAPNSEIKEVLVSAKGRFTSYPREQITINEDGEPILLTEIKLKTATLCDEIPLIWKKCSVLENLLKEGKIPHETYKEFHEEFEKVKENLKMEAEKTIEEIEKLEKACDERFRRLQLSKTNLEIEYAIGKIKDEIYELSIKDIVNELNNTLKEREDLEKMRSWLSNLLLGEKATDTELYEKEAEETQPEGLEERETAMEQEKPEVEEKVEPQTGEESSITVRII
ncbi:CdvA-like protein [Candidatus Bathyarchaeota archaeon]|nr:CdvA-like protein [Candidatus Bathyarchaeota archaeon]